MPATTRATDSNLFVKAAYGFGSVAFGIKDSGFGLFLMIYYNQVLGLPAQWVGTAIACALIADAFLDPIIGYVSDQWRSRLGRRHPFMYASALPVAISYWCLWNPPSGLSQVQLCGYLVALAIIVRTFVSIYEVPSSALVAELTTDYNQRTSFLGFRYLFGSWGSMILTLLTLAVFMKADATHRVGQLNPAGYATYSIVAALVMLSAILISSLGTQRYITPAGPHASSSQPNERFSFKRSWHEVKATARTRGVLPLFGAGLFAGMGMGVGGALLTYVNTYFWELSSKQLSLLATPVMIAGLCAVLLATRLSSRFGKRNASIGMHLIALCVTPVAPVLRLCGLFPANGSKAVLPILIGIMIVASTCSMVGSILWSSMTADVVEESQIATGRRSEGLLFAINAFILKCVSGLGVALGGVLLGLVAFPQNAVPGQVPAAVLNRLMIVDIGWVCLCSTLAIACLFAYPITKAMHQANLRRLGHAVPGEEATADASAEPPAPGRSGAAA